MPKDQDTLDSTDAPDRDALDLAMGIGFGSRPTQQAWQEETPTRIGRYNLLERLGEGGFGVVHLAEQTEPVRRRVAVKILKAGMDTREVVARFEAERQALARMDHENIASVFDGGATDKGRPYFVMELVHGNPITNYCDDHHLSVNERLRLFARVCQAVQHAHAKGVIHRDLKPRNVLITEREGEPIPKIIDFGIAKATQGSLTDKTVLTRGNQFMGTPAYMSPEQVDTEGIDIDTRSDVYSLGAMLYELLTGQTPIDKRASDSASFLAIQRLIQEAVVLRPSQRVSQLTDLDSGVAMRRATDSKRLAHVLRGDLDWIVLKALEKDRTRRYDTAQALAADIWRFLNQEPVTASPPSATYLLRKFAGKNRRLIATAAVFAVAMLIGTIVSSWLAVRATNAEEDALRLKGLADERLRREAAARNEVRDQRDRMRWDLYCAQMRLAPQTLRMPKGIRQFRQVLDRWRDRSNFHGWEWYYLNALLGSELQSFAGHVGPVNDVAGDPSGQFFASAGEDGTLRVWDVEAGKHRLTIAAHNAPVLSVCWSPDGRWLASASADRTVKVWDADTGELKTELEGHERAVTTVSWHQTKPWLASAGHDKTVRVWNPTTGDSIAVMRGHVGAVTEVAWNPDGTRLASASIDHTVRLWSPSDWTEGDRLWLRYGIKSIAWSPDGSQLAATNPYEPAVTVWDIETRKVVATLSGHANYVRDVAWSRDGRRLITTGQDHAMRVWDVATWRTTMTLNTDLQYAAAWHADGDRFVTAGFDGLVKTWSVSHGQGPKRLFNEEMDVLCVGWSSDGKRAAFATDDHAVRLWHTDSHSTTQLGSHKRRVFSLGWSGDGRLATGGLGGHIKVFDTNAGTETLDMPTGSSVWSVSWSPDARLVAAGCQNGRVQIWNATDGSKQAEFKAHAAELRAVSWHPDGATIATADTHGDVKLLDVASGREIWSVHVDENQVNGLSWSPDGQRLAVSTAEDADVKILRRADGSISLRLTGHTEWVFGTSWHPDGTRLATASADSTVRIWDTRTGQETLTLRGHELFARSVSWHPDGRRLVSAGRDGKVLIWDATAGYEASADRTERPEPEQDALSGPPNR